MSGFDRYESDRERDQPRPQGDGDPREPWEDEPTHLACEDIIPAGARLCEMCDVWVPARQTTCRACGAPTLKAVGSRT